MARWADDPKPRSPRRPPGWIPESRSERNPMIPRAEERRSLDVVHAVGQGEREVAPGDDLLGVAAVDSPPAELGQLAQVLPAGEALPAPAAGAGQPRQAYPLAGSRDPPDDLVPGDHGSLSHLDVARDDLEVCPAHPAGRHLDDHLAGAGGGVLDIAEREVVRRRQDHRLHEGIVGPGPVSCRRTTADPSSASSHAASCPCRRARRATSTAREVHEPDTDPGGDHARPAGRVAGNRCDGDAECDRPDRDAGPSVPKSPSSSSLCMGRPRTATWSSSR